MTEIKESPIKTLTLKLSDKNNLLKLNDTLTDLNNNGFEEVEISIYGSSKKMAEKLGFDSELFNAIVEMQDIPGWTVLNLLKSKGALKESDFGNINEPW